MNVTEDVYGSEQNGTESWRVLIDLTLKWEEVKPFVLASLFLAISIFTKFVSRKYWKFASTNFPESSILILVGVIFGGLFVWINGNGDGKHNDELEQLPSFQTMFFWILLPPIMLEAAFDLHKKDFINILTTVLLHAVLGTFINFFLVGGCLCIGYYHQTEYFGPASNNTTHAEIFVFSSLVSAVEPESVLEIFESVGVSPQLYYLVKGESLINDGVVFSLYSMTNALTKIQADMHLISVVDVTFGILSFFTICLGGLIIGLLLGIFSSWMSKFTDHRMLMVEPLLIFLSDYLAYLLAEMLGWSGVISLFGCALIQAQYAFKNLSNNGIDFVETGVKIAASISDSIIFLYLGVRFWRDQTFDWGFIIMTLVICFFVRFIAVYLVSLITRDGEGDDDWRSRVIMSYAGIRGSVSFALASLHEQEMAVTDRLKTSSKMLASTTHILIFTTTFIQGTTIRFLFNLLEIHKKRNQRKQKNSLSKDVHGKMIDQMMIAVHAIASSEEKKGRHMYAHRRGMHNFFRKWLLEEKPQNSSDLSSFDLSEVFDLEDHYINLYGPDLITGSVKREASVKRNASCHESSDESEGEENDPLVPTTPAWHSFDFRTSVAHLMNVVNPSSQTVGAHKVFINAVNASTIRTRTEHSSSYNTAKNLENAYARRKEQAKKTRGLIFRGKEQDLKRNKSLRTLRQMMSGETNDSDNVKNGIQQIKQLRQEHRERNKSC